MEAAEQELERRSKFLSSLIQKKKGIELKDQNEKLNVRVRASDMPLSLQNMAFKCARDSLDNMPGKKIDSKRLALVLKKAVSFPIALSDVIILAQISGNVNNFVIVYPSKGNGLTVPGKPVSSEGNYVGVNVPRYPSQPLTQGPWSTELCDCCEDVSNCCLTCCCPCITFGKIAEIVDKDAIAGTTSCGICAMIGHLSGHSSFYTCTYRYRIRQEYMLKATPCGDCLVHHFCQTCAICQEYRELKNCGFDMTIGWQENVNRQNRVVVMAPVVQGGMRR